MRTCRRTGGKAETEMIKTTITVDGMMCGICETHVCEAIRKAIPAAKKVTASRSKKRASFLTEEAVDPTLVQEAVNRTGYSCTKVTSEPYEKKGLFGWK